MLPFENIRPGLFAHPIYSTCKNDDNKYIAVQGKDKLSNNYIITK